MKPTSVQVGQRWHNPKCDPKYNPHTVIDLKDFVCDGKSEPGCTFRTGNGELRSWPVRDIVAWWDYLAASTPEATREAPAPAKGQRWRDTQDGEVFTLTEQDGYGDWYDSNGGGYWPKRCFTNGRLAFVDHATPSPAPAGMSGAPQTISKAERGGEAGDSPSAVDPCKGKRAAAQTGDAAPRSASRSTAALRDMTALQPLATFSLPGSNPAQRIAYATRSVKP